MPPHPTPHVFKKHSGVNYIDNSPPPIHTPSVLITFPSFHPETLDPFISHEITVPGFLLPPSWQPAIYLPCVPANPCILGYLFRFGITKYICVVHLILFSVMASRIYPCGVCQNFSFFVRLDNRCIVCVCHVLSAHPSGISSVFGDCAECCLHERRGHDFTCGPPFSYTVPFFARVPQATFSCLPIGGEGKLSVVLTTMSTAFWNAAGH